MDRETVEKLLVLNREFYATFARPFADSRSLSDPALTSILPYIPQRARVLDVGCGNGRLARLLGRERPGASYVGVDAVPELIEGAREQTAQLDISAEFHVMDIVRLGLSRKLFDHRDTEDTEESNVLTEKMPVLCETNQNLGALSASVVQFDCIVCLAVLHHIPGFDLRARILPQIRQFDADQPHQCFSS